MVLMVELPLLRKSKVVKKSQLLSESESSRTSLYKKSRKTNGWFDLERRIITIFLNLNGLQCSLISESFNIK